MPVSLGTPSPPCRNVKYPGTTTPLQAEPTYDLKQLWLLPCHMLWQWALRGTFNAIALSQLSVWLHILGVFSSRKNAKWCRDVVQRRPPTAAQEAAAANFNSNHFSRSICAFASDEYFCLTFQALAAFQFMSALRQLLGTNFENSFFAVCLLNMCFCVSKTWGNQHIFKMVEHPQPCSWSPPVRFWSVT